MTGEMIKILSEPITEEDKSKFLNQFDEIFDMNLYIRKCEFKRQGPSKRHFQAIQELKELEEECNNDDLDIRDLRPY